MWPLTRWIRVASFAIANGGLCYAIDGYHCADNMRVFDIELPELKHFSSGGFPTREGSHIDDKDPFSTTFQSKVGNASLAVQWDSISGQRISQTCTGDDCAAYFGGTCEVTFTKTCNNSPISDENFQHCPTNLRGENTITTCELDI